RILRGDGASGNRVLWDVVTAVRNLIAAGEVQRITLREQCGKRLRVAGSRGSMLILSTDVERPAAPLGQGGEAGNVVEAGLVGAAVVVEERLAKMEAVLKDRAGDALQACVDRLHAIDRPARAAG